MSSVSTTMTFGCRCFAFFRRWLRPPPLPLPLPFPWPPPLPGPLAPGFGACAAALTGPLGDGLAVEPVAWAAQATTTAAVATATASVRCDLATCIDEVTRSATGGCALPGSPSGDRSTLKHPRATLRHRQRLPNEGGATPDGDQQGRSTRLRA